MVPMCFHGFIFSYYLVFGGVKQQQFVLAERLSACLLLIFTFAVILSELSILVIVMTPVFKSGPGSLVGSLVFLQMS